MPQVKRILPTVWPPGTTGIALYTAVLFMTAASLPATSIDPEASTFLLGIGVLAAWRYSWGVLNFIRSVIYRTVVFPRWRRTATEHEEELMPSRVYILMTVYRIQASTASRAIRAAVEEAIASNLSVTIVASVVEMQDELLFKSIFASYETPERIELKIVRIAGTGKRSGLSHGFRAISRDMPPLDALVVVMDGDTIFLPGSLRRCVPFFKMEPKLGAVTSDEIVEVRGSRLQEQWHEMRFAQRQIYMSSVSLSRRVMTLTGRMSIFRADIVTQSEFIEHVTGDQLEHWRLGRFNFLTGDDKSSLYWVMKQGYEQIYIPDTQVLTQEDPPHWNFFTASTQLMFRWFGNMLRTNERILNLGPFRMPFFVWWAFLDQRISMWTALAGPIFAIMLAVKYGAIFMAYYAVWIGFIRLIMTLMIFSARKEVSWRYPFLLYYNQVYGSLIKTWVMFRLDIQSWTRQKTKLQRNLTRGQYLWNTWTSHIVHATAVIIFVCAIGLASSVLAVPHATIRTVLGPGHYSVMP